MPVPKHVQACISQLMTMRLFLLSLEPDRNVQTSFLWTLYEVFKVYFIGHVLNSKPS